MGRLINADVLIKALGKSVGNNGNIIKIDVMDVKSLIKEQPTAFDVDGVVEQLRLSEFDLDEKPHVVLNKAISIVKGGQG